jgi:hypothetical protein
MGFLDDKNLHQAGQALVFRQPLAGLGGVEVAPIEHSPELGIFATWSWKSVAAYITSG